MDNKVEVREFLTSRRAKISPQQAGLPVSGKRRVPGLRRSEVAALAGMSVEYYAQLERGALARVSAGVLDALARALQLDDAERVHLLRCDVELLVSGEETARRLVAMYTTPDVVDQRRAIRAALALQPGEQVLDIGSGPGFLSG